MLSVSKTFIALLLLGLSIQISGQITATTSAIFPGLRITSHTPKNVSSVLAAFYAEVGTPPPTRFASIVANISAFDQPNQDKFVAATKGILGSVGFTLLGVLTFDTWFPLFNVNTDLILRRFIIGNPHKLVTTFAPLDIPTVMYLPLEIVIRERAEGGTDIIYNKPSRMVTVLQGGPQNYAKIIAETRVLDKMMADLTALIAKP